MIFLVCSFLDGVDDRLHRQFPEFLSRAVDCRQRRSRESTEGNAVEADDGELFRNLQAAPAQAVQRTNGKPVVVGKERSWLVGKRQDTIERRLSTR